jgi:hypothetical protein
MDEVPVIVVEDMAINLGVRNKMGDGYSYKGHRFVWHRATECKLHDSNVWQRFLNWLSGTVDLTWGTMPCPCLIFLDLGFPLTLQETMNAELMSWLEGEYQAADKQRVGLYMLGKLLQNQNWSGLVVVATSLGYKGPVRKAVKKLEVRFPQPKIVVHVASAGLSDTEDITADEVLQNDGFDQYLAHFGNILERIWPKETNKWYTSDSSVPHTFPEDIKQQAECENAIRSYLRSLLGYKPPEVWFEEGPAVLWEDLLHLVGSCAAHEGGQRNLTLGNVALLLAAVAPGSAKWAPSIGFKKTAQILPQQTRDQVEKAVLALVKNNEGLFYILSRAERVDKNGRAVLTDDPLVWDVPSLTSDILAVDLKFDCKTTNKQEREPLLTKVANILSVGTGEKHQVYDGNAFTAYLSCLIEFARSKEGRKAQCVINLLPISRNGENCTQLEFRACR